MSKIEDKSAEENVPKRLAPTVKTIRELFGKSGNLCYFPNCPARLFDNKNNFIAQIVHIEGVKGERFNESMTNEDRRSVNNLMLMCYPHHIATNDEEKFTVAFMKRYKSEHEGKFTEKLNEAYQIISDNADIFILRPVTGLKYIDTILDLIQEDKVVYDQFINGFSSLSQSIYKLPIPERMLLNIIVTRGNTSPVGEYEKGLCVLYEEAKSASGLSLDDFKSKLQVLEHHEFISVYEDDKVWWIDAYKVSGSWNYLAILKYFCEGGKINLENILVHLDFSLLNKKVISTI